MLRPLAPHGSFGGRSTRPPSAGVLLLLAAGACGGAVHRDTPNQADSSLVDASEPDSLDAGEPDWGDGSVPDLATACGDLFDALDSSPCPGYGLLPGTHPTRARFIQLCQLRLGAPGASPHAAASAERCAGVVQAAAATCATTNSSACAALPGTRPAGAPCGAATQCASGYCVGPASTSAERLGQLASLASDLTACGVCVDTIAIGQACTFAPMQCNAGCTVINPPCTGSAMCAPQLGPACNNPASCSSATCVAVPSPVVGGGGGGLGVACRLNSDCNIGFMCGPGGKCIDGVAVGASCDPAVSCTGGAVCDPATLTCKARVFAGPGAACNGMDVQCQTGFCIVASSNGSVPASGTCPALIPDGQPCQISGAATCDTYATCAPQATDAGCCYVGGMGGSAGGPATFSDGGTAAPPTPQNTCVLVDPSTCN